MRRQKMKRFLLIVALFVVPVPAYAGCDYIQNVLYCERGTPRTMPPPAAYYAPPRAPECQIGTLPARDQYGNSFCMAAPREPSPASYVVLGILGAIVIDRLFFHGHRR